MQRRVVGSTCRAEDTATWSEMWRSDGEYSRPLDNIWWSHLINDNFFIHLEAAHIPRVAGILEAVLVALEEELQLEPGQCGHGHLVHSWEEARSTSCHGLCQGTYSHFDTWDKHTHARAFHWQTNTVKHTNTHTQTHTNTYIHTCTRTHMYARIQIHVRECLTKTYTCMSMQYWPCRYSLLYYKTRIPRMHTHI